MLERIGVFVLGLLLLASSFYLVSVQYNIRKTILENEREMAIHHRLLDDEAELQMKVRRASLTGVITESATALGLQGASGDNTVILVKESDGSIRLSKNTREQLREAEEISKKEEAKK